MFRLLSWAVALLVVAAGMSLGGGSKAALAANTTTSLTSTPNPSMFGQNVSLTAKVVSDDGLGPSGTVSFRNNGTEIGTATLAVVGQVAQVVGGGTHSCALKTDGTVWCWGRNDDGQLGLGDTIDRTTPQAVGGLNDVLQIVAGSKHTCALTASGEVACWGANYSGQLGLGDTTNRTMPQAIDSLSGGLADRGRWQSHLRGDVWW